MASRPIIPSSEEIVREAARELGVAGLPPADARLAFNGLMKDLGDKTFEIYERYRATRQLRRHSEEAARRQSPASQRGGRR